MHHAREIFGQAKQRTLQDIRNDQIVSRQKRVCVCAACKGYGFQRDMIQTPVMMGLGDGMGVNVRAHDGGLGP